MYKNTLIGKSLVASRAIQWGNDLRVGPLADEFPAEEGTLRPFFSESVVEICLCCGKVFQRMSFFVEMAEVLGQIQKVFSVLGGPHFDMKWDVKIV